MGENLGFQECGRFKAFMYGGELRISLMGMIKDFMNGDELRISRMGEN